MPHTRPLLRSFPHLLVGAALALGGGVLLPTPRSFGAPPSNTFLRAFGQSDLSAPVGIAVDGAGNVYVNDQTLNVVKKFDPATGAVQLTFQQGQLAAGSRLMAVDGAHNLYVADYNTSRVQVFDTTSGQLERTIAAPNLSGPEAILLTGGELYVPDFDSSQVETFTPDGAYLGQFGSGSLGEPVGIAADPAGQFLIVNNYFDTIAMFDASDRFLGQFATAGPGALNRPRGVAIEPGTGNVFVTDTGNNRVVAYDPHGNYLSAFDGVSGTNEVAFSAPMGIAFDHAGNLDVVDSGNHRVDVFGDVPPTPVPTDTPTSTPTAIATAMATGTITPTPVGSLLPTPTPRRPRRPRRWR